MLLSKRTVVNHPDEDVEFEIRGLSWVELEEARSKASASQRQVIKDLGPDFMAALGGSDPDEADRALERLEEQRYHPSQFDTGAILSAGVLNWTYENGDGPIAVDEDSLALLDEATAVFLVGEIIEITRPPEGRSSAAALSVPSE